jgi:tetratricopeptide (TPR) repeat protein
MSFFAQAQETSKLYEQARKEFKAKEYRKAANTFSTVINQSSFYYEAYMYRGRCYHALQMDDSALTDFNSSIAKNNQYLTAYYYRGVYYFDMEKYQKAISDFDVVLKKKPDYSKALSYRGRSYEALDKDDLAMADYTHAIKKGTKNYDLYYRRALLYKKQNKLKLAVYDLGKVVELKPEFQQALSMRGIIEVQRGRYEQSLDDLNKAIALDVEDQLALEARAKAYFETDKLDLALVDYNRLVQHFHTRNTEIYLMRGRLFVSQGEYSKAQKDFSRILIIDPHNSEAAVEKAKVFMLKGHIQQSIPVSEMAIGFDEKNWEAYYVRGKAYYDLEKYPEALKDFNMAIKLHPTADAHFYRGQCRAEKGDVVGACEDLHTAEKMGSKQAVEKLKHVCN